MCAFPERWVDGDIEASAMLACSVPHCSSVTTDCSEEFSAFELVEGLTKDRASLVFLEARKPVNDISAKFLSNALEGEIVGRR